MNIFVVFPGLSTRTRSDASRKQAAAGLVEKPREHFEWVLHLKQGKTGCL